MNDPLEAQAAAWVQGATQAIQIIEEATRHPYGAPATPDTRQVAGQAMVQLCEGNADKARTLWKLIAADCHGYMPEIVAVAVVRCSNTTNLVPDVEAPVPS